MRYTNKWGIDEAIAQAVMNDQYEKVGDISVTRLIRPPQITALEAVHEDDLEMDVSDGLWMLLGRAVHDIIEKGSLVGVQRVRLMTQVGPWQVSGEFDIWYSSGVLKDYKVTSVWAFLLGAKIEWEQQLNLYRLLAVQHGMEVSSLFVAAILRDWSKRESMREGRDYPPIPFIEQTVPMWPMEQAYAFLHSRVEEHMTASTTLTARECTAEERWAKAPVWAVKKAGAKRAARLFSEEPLAQAMARAQGMEVEYRPGENVRCSYYCPVVRWCQQAKSLGVEAATDV